MRDLERSWLEGLCRGLDPDPEPDEFAEDRERCKRLSPFIEGAWHAIEPDTTYLRNWHIDLISEHLEAVTACEILRLLITMPPRMMKSIACSVMWPLWEWRESPWMRYMFVTYASELSKDHSDMRRAVLSSPWYRERWGHVVKVVKDDVFTVRNDRRGVFQATSFGGTATGKGANRLVFDDPHNPRQAESDLERTQVVTDYGRTFGSRLNDKKRDAIVTVMQRTHESDVASECERLGYVHCRIPCVSEGRTVITFPSGREVVREDGDLLWPEREGPDQVEAMRVALGSYGFAGQYQQRPAPAGGGMFKSFPVVHALPTGCRFVRYWDKAGTQGGGAYTAGCKMALTPNGMFIITHMVRGQWSAGERERIIRQTAESDGHDVIVWVEQEPGSGGKESAENTVINLAGYTCYREPVTGDKETRARPMAAQAEVGNVLIYAGDGTAWHQPFIDEARMFPNGRYKDQVDAAGGAFNKLALMVRPIAGASVPALALPPVPTWTTITHGGQVIPAWRG